jgi:aconitate hydratase
MGVLPLQFTEGETRETLGLTGEETYSICDIPAAVSGAGMVTIQTEAPDGRKKDFQAKTRIDTPQEAEYYRNGGILPYVLRQLIATSIAA